MLLKKWTILRNFLALHSRSVYSPGEERELCLASRKARRTRTPTSSSLMLKLLVRTEPHAGAPRFIQKTSRADRLSCPWRPSFAGRLSASSHPVPTRPSKSDLLQGQSNQIKPNQANSNQKYCHLVHQFLVHLYHCAPLQSVICNLKSSKPPLSPPRVRVTGVRNLVHTLRPFLLHERKPIAAFPGVSLSPPRGEGQGEGCRFADL